MLGASRREALLRIRRRASPQLSQAESLAFGSGYGNGQAETSCAARGGTSSTDASQFATWSTFAGRDRRCCDKCAAMQPDGRLITRIRNGLVELGL